MCWENPWIISDSLFTRLLIDILSLAKKIDRVRCLPLCPFELRFDGRGGRKIINRGETTGTTTTRIEYLPLIGRRNSLVNVNYRYSTIMITRLLARHGPSVFDTLLVHWLTIPLVRKSATHLMVFSCCCPFTSFSFYKRWIDWNEPNLWKSVSDMFN